MRVTSLSILVLIFDQLLGRFLQTLIAVARRQRQGIDQRIRGRPDLAQSDLRVFPPAAAWFGGTGISGSLASPRSAS